MPANKATPANRAQIIMLHFNDKYVLSYLYLFGEGVMLGKIKPMALYTLDKCSTRDYKCSIRQLLYYQGTLNTRHASN